jgi:hypothetical protein
MQTIHLSDYLASATVDIEKRVPSLALVYSMIQTMADIGEMSSVYVAAIEELDDLLGESHKKILKAVELIDSELEEYQV